MDTVDPGRRAKRLRLKRDFAYYAGHCLKIRSKSGAIVPLRLNGVQVRVHAAAEEQRARTGRIRILVLKARQPGISTYVEGRFYWRTTHEKGVRAFILTHRDQATHNLFAIAKRFHDNAPPGMKPQIKASNAKELDFLRLDSGYRVGTAKAEGVGRADTIHERYLDRQRPDLLGPVNDMLMPAWPPAAQIADNQRLACAIARVRFWMVPTPLPAVDNIDALGRYWKDFYNTSEGAGSAEEWAGLYRRYVKEWT